MEEFDRFAIEYQGMLEASLEPFGGFNPYYLQQKVYMLRSALSDENVHSILDFGCGLGATTAMIQEAFPTTRVVGVDISETSIDRARQTNLHIEFGCTKDESFMKECVGKFDAVYIANVFHHIKVEDRCRVLETVKSMLTPEGRLFFCEHNPYNFLTKWVVSRCEFDRDAILVAPSESRLLLRKAGFNVINTKYLLFFPYTLRFLSRFESIIRWLPIGAQYCLSASILIEPKRIQEVL